MSAAGLRVGTSLEVYTTLFPSALHEGDVAPASTGLLIPPANAPYMLNSTYTLSLGGDISWSDVWFSHPAGFGNLLTVDGVEIPNGQHTAYDAARTCAAIP